MAEAYLGEIRMFAGNYAPYGWALCNGATLAISSNQALFAVIGTQFGGDGVTNFALPNLQGRAPIHQGTGQGLTPRIVGQLGGAEQTQMTISQLPTHTHAATFTPSGGGSAAAVAVAAVDGTLPSPVGNILAQAKVGAAHISPYAPASAATGSLGGVTGGGGGGGTVTVTPTGNGLPVPTMPPFLCVCFIICLNGIFPSRS